MLEWLFLELLLSEPDVVKSLTATWKGHLKDNQGPGWQPQLSSQLEANSNFLAIRSEPSWKWIFQP
jgi:hypothetical protein